jgi:hypothetical protein
MGTSLQVYPFAALIDEVAPPTKMVYINKGIDDAELAKMFEDETNVFLDGEADLWCHKISDILHWKQDFDSLIAKNRKNKLNIDDVTNKMKDMKIEEKKESSKVSEKSEIKSQTAVKDEKIENPIKISEPKEEVKLASDPTTQPKL